MAKKIKIILTLFLGIQIIGISLLKNHTEFVEIYYSKGIYPISAKLKHIAFGWIPFSIGDVFYTLGIFLILRWLVLKRKDIVKKPIDWILQITSTLSVAYFIFHLFWGFNYYREPLYKSFNLNAEYTTEALIKTTTYLISESNTLHSSLTKNDSLLVTIPYKKTEILEMVPKGYKNLSETYSFLSYDYKSLKPSLISLPLTYMGFSGYLNPFTNEAQVDYLIPRYKYPTTASHEVAHQIGYAAENEANFIGCLATLHHNDTYFKYSGYTFALKYCLNEVYRRDQEQYFELLKLVNKGILKNYKEVGDFWRSYKNPFEPAFEKTYDKFLKANNQQGGSESYNYVVALFVNYFNNKT